MMDTIDTAALNLWQAVSMVGTMLKDWYDGCFLDWIGYLYNVYFEPRINKVMQV